MRTFEEFWPFYVREHSNPTNRALHFVGTTLGMGCVVAAAVTRRPALLLGFPLFGYGFAWAGHFGFEGNRPASWKYPLWSLRADFRMWWHIASGTMNAEVARATESNGVHAETTAAPAAVSPDMN
jgi:hypothetical protein